MALFIINFCYNGAPRYLALLRLSSVITVLFFSVSILAMEKSEDLFDEKKCERRFIKAAYNGHVSELESELSSLSKMSERKQKQLEKKALQIAAEHGHLGCVKCLFKESIHKNLSSELLDVSFRKGFFETVHFLLKHNAIPREWATLLETATRSGRVEIIQALLACDDKNCTWHEMMAGIEKAVEIAVYIGNLKALKMLLEEYYRYEKTKSSDEVIERVIAIAARDGDLDALAFLLANCEDSIISASEIARIENSEAAAVVLEFWERGIPEIDSRSAHRVEELSLLLKSSKIPINLLYEIANMALQKKNFDLIKILLPFIESLINEATFAVAWKRLSGDKVGDILDLEIMSDRLSRIEMVSVYFCAALKQAIHECNSEFTELLLNAKRVSKPTLDSVFLFVIAQRKGAFELLQLLLSKCDIEDACINRALDRAVHNNKLKEAMILLKTRRVASQVINEVFLIALKKRLLQHCKLFIAEGLNSETIKKAWRIALACKFELKELENLVDFGLDTSCVDFSSPSYPQTKQFISILTSPTGTIYRKKRKQLSRSRSKLALPVPTISEFYAEDGFLDFLSNPGMYMENVISHAQNEDFKELVPYHRPLIWALILGHEAAVEFLCKMRVHRSNISRYFKCGLTSLGYSILTNNIRSLDILIESGYIYDLNADKKLDTEAIIRAAKVAALVRNYSVAVILLLKAQNISVTGTLLEYLKAKS